MSQLIWSLFVKIGVSPETSFKISPSVGRISRRAQCFDSVDDFGLLPLLGSPIRDDWRLLKLAAVMRTIASRSLRPQYRGFLVVMMATFLRDVSSEMRVASFLKDVSNEMRLADCVPDGRLRS